MKTFHELIAEARDRGLVVNNLFETRKGDWQANYRRASDNYCFMYGRGASPEEALLHALDPEKYPPEYLVKRRANYAAGRERARQQRAESRQRARQTKIVQDVFD